MSARTRLALPGNIQRSLARLSAKDFHARVLRFPLLVAIVLPVFWLFEALADLVFNFSWATRLGFMVVAAALVGWLFHRHIILPFRRRLNLRAAALLAERSFPQFRTGLISAVDFTSSPDGLAPRTALLIQILLRQVGALVDRTDLVRGIIDPRPVRRLLLAALATLIAAGALLWFFQPRSLVLARRVFLSADPLPSRTIVIPISGDLTLNAGANADLAARAQGVIPPNARLIVTYADGHHETIPVTLSPVEPGVFRFTLRNVLQSFRYHFEINDGVGPAFQVKTRTLPTLTRTRFIYLPPSYTGRPEVELSSGSLSLLAGSRLVIEGEASQSLKSATLELKGLGQSIRMDNGDPTHNVRLRLEANEAKIKDLQARVEKLRPDVTTATADRDAAQKKVDAAQQTREAVPAGDERRKLDYKWELANGALREATGLLERARGLFEQATRESDELQRQTADLKKQLDQALAAPPPDQDAAAKQKRIVRAEIPIPKEGLTGLSLHLVDEDGLASENDPVYRVTITDDKPPVAEILLPKADRKTVLAGDRVPVKFRARDDYRLEKVALRYVVLRPNADGEAVPAEEGSVAVTIPAGATNFTGDYTWDLAAFVPPLSEGCSVTYWLDARDYATVYSDHPAVSRRMNLVVVSPEEKKKELIAEMEKAAREIQRLSERQRKATEKTDSSLRR